MNDPTMSEVPPPRSKAPAVVAAPKLESERPHASEIFYPKYEDSDAESETQPLNVDRLELTEKRILARLDALESLLAKHVSIEASAKANMCENLEKYANTVALNNALLTTSIDVMKGIQADVNRISWQQFEAVAKPRKEEAADPSKDVGDSTAVTSTATHQAGGCGWVASKTPIPTHQSHSMTRIEANEFAAIKLDGNLKHVWVYIDSSDDQAHKVRVQSLTANDVRIVYSSGGCMYPYAKTCKDWDKFEDVRIKFLVSQQYTHCRTKT